MVNEMHSKILGSIGMLWGGTILINELLDPVYGPGAYDEVQIAACVFAGVMFFVGAYNLLKKPKIDSPHEDNKQQ